MGAVLVTPAEAFPISLAEAKTQCRVDGNDEDAYLNSLIAAATAHIEKHTGRSILEQTWRLTLSEFEDEIFLPQGPTRSVTSVAYYDRDGVDQTLSSGWALDNTKEPARIVKDIDATWPASQTRFDAVRITYVTGYSEAPAPVKHAALMLVSHWYLNREATGPAMQEVPLAVGALLANYRTHGF